MVSSGIKSVFPTDFKKMKKTKKHMSIVGHSAANENIQQVLILIVVIIYFDFVGRKEIKHTRVSVGVSIRSWLHIFKFVSF